MLHVQEYLINNSTEKLKTEYGIKMKEYKDFIGLNYCQIKSPKSHPITVECRSLKLYKNSLSVASRSFDRFFNYGEVPDMYKDFDITTSVIMEKVDGSLVPIWYNQIDERWEVSSRSSIFGESKLDNNIKTFRELVLDILDNFDLFNKEFTYIFEYIGPDNRIVTPYETSQLVLLGIRNNYNGDYKTIQDMGNLITLINNPKVRMVKLYEYDSFDKILEATKNFKGMEEGFVCWDTVRNLRIKIKSKQYVAIHRIHGSLSNIKDIIEVVITGETTEILIYLPQLSKSIVMIEETIERMLSQMEEIYVKIKNIKEQKDYAKCVFQHNKLFKGVLFSSRKNNTLPTIEYNNLLTNDKVYLIYNFMK